ncbi:hypothetical protein Vadar_021485 [Vaccinium darrowii]|uniref:Uncharacterized protein n=1 Tax=Vaccinium darrowii TaxID=229202 RepID=A0ACB7XBB2_9ERIC|nr:hypothetical protein Vadar_021485 [Vaccinium darrowii]
MRGRRLVNPLHEVQIFSSMPVGIRSETSKGSSNLKRQRRRRNKVSKRVEQESVAANVMVAIEKALGDYNDDFGSSTESTTGSVVESEIESESQENVSTTAEEQFAKLIKQAEKDATSKSMSGPVTRSMAKSKELAGGVRCDGSVLHYSSSSSSGESSPSTKSGPRSITKVVSVMMADVNDDEQSSNSQQNQQLLEERIASLQEQLKKRDEEMSQLMEQIKGLQAQGKQKVYAFPGGSLESPKFTEGNGHFFTDPIGSNMSPILMAMIDEMVKKQVKKAKEKDDEGFRMITKPYPAWVDTVPFPPGFSQPDFKMFGGTGDPRQHIAHFLSRCGPIAQNEALCLQLFVQSLEGSAFTWYSNLPEGSIPSWDYMVKEFLRQFCNTQRRVENQSQISLQGGEL